MKEGYIKAKDRNPTKNNAFFDLSKLFTSE